MKNLPIVLAALFMFLMASCKKDNTIAPVDPTQPTTKKIAKMESNYSDGSTEYNAYNYDTQGRLTSYEDDDDVTTFDYSTPNKVLATRKKRTTQVANQFYECDLNDKGLVQKNVIKLADGRIYGEYRYTYDDAGYIKTEEGIFLDYSFKNEYDIVNGNLTNYRVYRNNVLDRTTTYKYDKTVKNTLGWRGAGYWNSSVFGKELKNAATETITTDTNGKITWHIKLSYETDAQGYITKFERNYPQTGFWEKTTVNYQ
ncbi:MAG: hypothetical protein JNL70_04025 [Saprospiraceae bacterium]|nr:hypothetical protein [Saprospiraceae bacterium]